MVGFKCYNITHFGRIAFSNFVIFTRKCYGVNVIESKRFFSLAVKDDLNIIKANRLWRQTFPTAINAADIVHPDSIKSIPTETDCDPSKPADITISVIVGAEVFKSHWFAHRSPAGHIHIEGLLLDTRTLADDHLIASVLFSINHNLMAPIAHIKGLINLLELQPDEQDRIVRKIQERASLIDDLIESINRELLG